MNLNGKIRVEGLDSVLELFRDLPPNVIGKLVKPAMKEAGNLLKGELYRRAKQQLAGAEGRGYRRKKPGPHLSDTTKTRAKTYRKGGTLFVAIGFSRIDGGGYHAHLVEYGHRSVKGGTLSTDKGMNAAGERFLKSLGWTKGDHESGTVLRGRNKGKPKILKGAWKLGNEVKRGKAFGALYLGKRLRGGGKLTGTRTKAYPMLGPAWQRMARPMLITIENELRKIGPEAVRLAKNKQKRLWRYANSSAG